MNKIVYVGPNIPSAFLKRNTIYNGTDMFPQNKLAVKLCPAIGQLFVPIDQLSVVRRELRFDYGGNMRGTSGKYVTFYREVEKWLAKRAEQSKTPSTEGVKLKTNA